MKTAIMDTFLIELESLSNAGIQSFLFEIHGGSIKIIYLIPFYISSPESPSNLQFGFKKAHKLTTIFMNDINLLILIPMIFHILGMHGVDE